MANQTLYPFPRVGHKDGLQQSTVSFNYILFTKQHEMNHEKKTDALLDHGV